MPAGRGTRLKGNMAVSQAFSYFNRFGYSVWLPVGDAGGATDLIVMLGPSKPKRVQCKYSENRHRAMAARNKIIWQVGLSNYAYSTESFDFLFVSTPRADYLIDWPLFCEELGRVPSTLVLGEKFERYKLPRANASEDVFYQPQAH